MSELPRKVTVPDVRSQKGEPRLTMVTAYDYPSARAASEAGVDVILVGDSVANVVHGMESTLEVDLEVMILHTRAVSRARPHSLVVADMPWMSYHVSIEDSVRNAGRLIREGGAEAVKLEGGSKRTPVVRAIVDAEIPVMGHLGLTPQSVNAMGGYKVQGKALDAARELVADARSLEKAGVFSIVLEGIPDVLADLITREVAVPTIGIGAGDGTDGQVLVFHDVLGFTTGHQPKFVRRYAELHGQAVEALRRFVTDVRSGAFPSDDETYHVQEELAERLLDEVTPSGGLASSSSS